MIRTNKVIIYLNLTPTHTVTLKTGLISEPYPEYVRHLLLLCNGAVVFQWKYHRVWRSDKCTSVNGFHNQLKFENNTILYLRYMTNVEILILNNVLFKFPLFLKGLWKVTIRKINIIFLFKLTNHLSSKNYQITFRKWVLI